MTEFDSIEYGVFWHLFPNDPHRTFSEESKATEWISEFVEMGGRLDAFTIKWRGIGFWTEMEDE